MAHLYITYEDCRFSHSRDMENDPKHKIKVIWGDGVSEGHDDLVIGNVVIR